MHMHMPVISSGRTSRHVVARVALARHVQRRARELRVRCERVQGVWGMRA